MTNNTGPKDMIFSTLRLTILLSDFVYAMAAVLHWDLGRRIALAAGLCSLLFAAPGLCDDEFAAPLPAGVQAVWDTSRSYRETTATRERICINGLWRWQPTGRTHDQVPAMNWGYFKVPGCWPGITDYMQKDCQTLYSHASWKDQRLAGITAAWYQREITIPESWNGRRLALSVEYLNSHAEIYVDGNSAGELRFPGGDLDLTPLCRTGGKHILSLRVTAMPLKGVLLSYIDSNSAREVLGNVARRGLCGDVYLMGTPAGARILDVKVDTSVRKREVTFDAALEGLAPDAQYALHARVTAKGQLVREFTSDRFQVRDLKDGRSAFSEKWESDRLWDLNTPQNVYDVSVSLEHVGDRVLDTSFSLRFGYREFWIDGRDFYLNGSRIFLSAVPLDNAQIGAALASYEEARESLRRLKNIGINFVYTHNYGCQPGDHLSFTEILRAANDVGMLVALSQPHFSHYEWQKPDADLNNGYARHAEFYVRAAQNHPAVVAYAMSHNANGYGEDMNPDMIDGLVDPRSPGELNYTRRALRAEAIVKHFDPGRIVYHHAGGNLGSMHTINFYPNFVPPQEMSDWFEHWSTKGVKPAFTCEYGAPFSWDWAMYRGWFQGERSFGSGRVPWDFCLAEWNSQFFGDRAFQTSEFERTNLRWEAKQFKQGNFWQRWEYPHDLNSKLFEQRYPVIAQYITDNWRAFRTWEVSAISPWEHAQYWILRDGVDRGRKELPVDWQSLQRPGLSADYLAQRYERMDLAYERSDWVPTAAAQALLRNNLPLLAYIAGRPAAFTSKDHIFLPGDTVEKQAIVINNSRQAVECDCTWSLGLPQPVTGTKHFTVPTGQQVRIPLHFPLPDALPAGTYDLRASFKFSSGSTQDDAFAIHVRPRPSAPQVHAKVALFDPRGETETLLKRLSIGYQSVDANADLSKYDLLIVGKSALTVDSPAPDISRVRDGLRVIVFEQSSDVLEKRFGFRVTEYGLRWVFPRVPDHPLLAGIGEADLRDWRGAATILAPRLQYELRPRYGPTVKWCDIPVPRLWRCGNRGNVASVLIEKPARGNFLPIVDGGYSLQYSPLLEYREGQGLIMFCQVDVTGRTEIDPAADALARNLLQHVSAAKPAANRTAMYVGDPAGREHLERCGLAVQLYESGKLSSDKVLIVGPGGSAKLAGDSARISSWLKNGGNLLAIGLDQQEVHAFLPRSIQLKKAEHISAYFPPSGVDSPLQGIGPADVHNRDPKELSLVAAGATIFGDGVLAQAENMNVVFCQLIPWQFGGNNQLNLKKTYRRSSFLLSRALANMGVTGSTPIVTRFATPVEASSLQKRWQDGLYLDQPEEWDDPYRFFRW